MQIYKYCNLSFLIKFSVSLIFLSLVVFFADKLDLQLLRGTVGVETQVIEKTLTSEQKQELVEQIINKQFNFE